MTTSLAAFNLPVEIVLQICRHVDDHELSLVRLVSRGVERSVFHEWSTRFLRMQTCYFLDPQRLARLLNVLSSSRLVTSVRSVRLTLHPFEDKSEEDVHLAPLAHESSRDARSYAWRFHLNAEITRVTVEDMDIARLRHILELLRDKRILLMIDVGNFPTYVGPFPGIIATLLDLVADISTPIHSLILSTNCTPKILGLLRRRDRSLLPCVRDMKALDFTDRHAALDRESYRGRLLAVQQILVAASNFEDLSLSGWGFWRAFGLDIVPSYTGDILLANNLRRLRALRLQGCCLGAEALHEALRRARHTLQDVRFEHVCLLGDCSGWMESLKELQIMPRLISVVMAQLTYASNSRLEHAGDIIAAVPLPSSSPSSSISTLVPHPHEQFLEQASVRQVWADRASLARGLDAIIQRIENTFR